MYAEAMAEDKNQNHYKVLQFLKEGTLARIGYPASGSFIDFLKDSYGLSRLRNMYVSNPDNLKEDIHDSLENTFNKTTEKLEQEWLMWLRKKLGFDKQLITDHFGK